MGVEFLHKPDDPNGLWYKRTREDLFTNKEMYELGQAAKEFKNDRLHNRGFSKDRNMRHAGQIPAKIFFEKIQAEGQDYWEKDKGKNMKRWLNENTHFRTTDGRL